jgi:hypothetical protein
MLMANTHCMHIIYTAQLHQLELQTVGAFHGAEVPFVWGAKPWFAGIHPRVYTQL